MPTFIDPTLIDLLRRMKRIDPAGWIDDVADAVRKAGGTDACDLLAMAADRAGRGSDRDDIPADRQAGDGEDGR